MIAKNKGAMMGFGNAMRNLFGSQKKAYSVGQYITAGFARWMSRDAKVFAEEGYERNVIAYRCIQIIARSLASVKLDVYVGDEKSETHPLVDLLKRPNPTSGGASFFESIASFNRTTGNAYIEALRNGAGEPSELWIWSPYKMAVVNRSNSQIPAAYVWGEGEATKRWDVDEITGASDLMQWKTWHPFDPDFGMSPMEPAAYSVDQHNSSSEWNQALLQNAAAPDGMLTTEGNLSDGQYERLREQIESSMSGTANARRPFIGEGGLKWTQLSFTPKDMDWLGGRRATAIDIASAYGVPVQLLGIEGSQTFANFEQARLSLWEDTVLPLLDELVDELNNWLTPMYKDGANLRIVYDVGSVEALENKRAAALVSVQNISFMTINEKRAAAGLEPLDVEGADDLWMDAGKLPLGFDVSQFASTDEAAKSLKAMGYSQEIAEILLADVQSNR